MAKHPLPVYVHTLPHRWPRWLSMTLLITGIVLTLALLMASQGLAVPLLAALGHAMINGLWIGGSFTLSTSLMLLGALGLSAERINPGAIEAFFKTLSSALVNLVTFGTLRKHLRHEPDITLYKDEDSIHLIGARLDEGVKISIAPSLQMQASAYTAPLSTPKPTSEKEDEKKLKDREEAHLEDLTKLLDADDFVGAATNNTPPVSRQPSPLNEQG